MSSKPLVLVARHGETALNAAGKFRGKSNPPLDEKGKRQAETLAEKLSHMEFSKMLSSDKLRAVQTAETIGEKINHSFTKTSKLRAWDVGEFSGKPKDKEHLEKLEEYVKHPSRTIPNGESLNHFKSRVRPVLRAAVKHAIRTGKPVLIVAHSSIIHELGDMFYKDHERILVHPGGLAGIFRSGRKLTAREVFKPKAPPKHSGDTVS